MLYVSLLDRSNSYIDLKNLLFDDDWSSKMKYCLLLASSFSSVSISFGRILTWGKDPVITTLYSQKFLEIFILILSKFLIQAFFLATVFTCFLHYEVILSDGPVYGKVINFYYKGLCFQGNLQPNQFCSTEEAIRLRQATLDSGVVGIFVMYYPTLLYIIVLQMKKIAQGRNKSRGFYESLILFIFPFVTNLSFYGDTEQFPRKDKTNILTQRIMKRSQSYNDVRSVRNIPIKRRSLPNISIGLIEPEEVSTAEFSLHQSKVLYMIFLVSTWFYFFMDIIHQVAVPKTFEEADIHKEITPPRRKLFLLLRFGLLFVNMIIWVRFTRGKSPSQIPLKLDSIDPMPNAETFEEMLKVLEELLQNSTDIVYCLFFVPVIWVHKMLLKRY